MMTAMSFTNRLKSLFRKPSQADNVSLYDVPSRRIVRIPASELGPGYIQARVQGIDEIVWVRADQLQQGAIQHPPFDEEVRSYIKDICSVFSEHRKLSLEEWEDGFRRDHNPRSEIALWHHAAEMYQAFTLLESSAERRAEIYRIIVACLTTNHDSVWQVIQWRSLTRAEVEEIISRFYGPAVGSGDATNS